VATAASLMDRQTDARIVRRIEADYSPATEKYELEDWLAQQLFDTYHNLYEGESELFRFREAVLVYAPQTELINSTRLIENNVTEHCILLSGFLYKNYGVKKLNHKADVEMQLMLMEHDFELMAVQITDEIIAWYETVSAMKEVMTMKQK
jgi:hypothetical protein